MNNLGVNSRAEYFNYSWQICIPHRQRWCEVILNTLYLAQEASSHWFPTATRTWSRCFTASSPPFIQIKQVLMTSVYCRLWELPHGQRPVWPREASFMCGCEWRRCFGPGALLTYCSGKCLQRDSPASRRFPRQQRAALGKSPAWPHILLLFCHFEEC